jgi:hypothetical protein
MQDTSVSASPIAESLMQRGPHAGLLSKDALQNYQHDRCSSTTTCARAMVLKRYFQNLVTGLVGPARCPLA